ncbi:MAG: DNA topoisomerase IB [Cellulomonadaceae bacterium]
MVRLRRVSVSSPGYSRRLTDGAVTFLDVDGTALSSDAEVTRCELLAVPPAWHKVWICRFANGHIQAYGLDAAGRGQYIYHPVWRERRNRAKHDRVLEVASRLPAARRRVGHDLAQEGLGHDTVMALAFRLLDLAYFRAGSEAYARRNRSYGLATIRREHVQLLDGRSVRFTYPAKSGQERDVVVSDPAVRSAVEALLRRRSGRRLLAWREQGRWVSARSTDVQAYVKERLGQDATPKDFRTWHATVMAARGLADAGAPPEGERARTAVVAGVVRTVAAALGNTPAVARASYIDPRLADLWEQGRTIRPGCTQRQAERHVLELLG